MMCGGVLLGLLIYVGLRRELYRRRIAICHHPLPGRMFPWSRCMFGECPWCDAIEKYDRTEPTTGPGPYRSRGT